MNAFMRHARSAVSVAVLVAAVVVPGCANTNPTVNIAPDAPVWLSEPIKVRDPYYLERGTNLRKQAKGLYDRPAGSICYPLPAERSTTKP